MARHTRNPWMAHGIDKRGRRYSRRKKDTPGNYLAGWLKIIAVIVVVGSVWQYITGNL